MGPCLLSQSGTRRSPCRIRGATPSLTHRRPSYCAATPVDEHGGCAAGRPGPGSAGGEAHGGHEELPRQGPGHLQFQICKRHPPARQSPQTRGRSTLSVSCPSPDTTARRHDVHLPFVPDVNFDHLVKESDFFTVYSAYREESDAATEAKLKLS
ncbi:uncharacterized protein LOC130679150 isoform X2 [Manis pentadactyla]|uniref:uncharacterized protein LOC130679150 isoform X2 n=1 Tax=Manis pentadactyla TaxID=143292 RepID=UPI00255CF5D5|nr:uncharacterized protein LOC130679150 isoform X2 [Manis pentadactyla]